jgi:tetratricopeptide (TPR) repeat protein
LLTLSDGSETPFASLAWSPDGTVIAAGDSLGRLHFWRLPESQPLATVRRASSDLTSRQSRVTADAHNKLGIALARQGKYEAAIDAYEESIRIQPESASALNNLAWLLAVCPELQLRDAKRAVELANKAVKLAPRNASFWNTLGTTQFRAALWQDAISALKRSEEIDPRSFAFGHNSFFLAMSHCQLGQNDEARDWYDQAVKWIEENRASLEKDGRAHELRRFRVEADEFLGISSPPR